MTRTAPALPPHLAAGLAQLSTPSGRAAATRRTAVGSLQDRYRERRDVSRPLSRAEAEAYAVYRMPATYAAVASVLARLRARGWSPRTLLDLGGGPGTAAWAAAEILRGLERLTVVERDAEMSALGRQLAAEAPAAAVRDAAWLRRDLSSDEPLPAADGVVLSYSLGELEPQVADAVVTRAASAAATVVVVEPGTPLGHAVVLAARARLIATGRHVVAPCPHDLACPLADVADWCHVGVRLPRSVAHRQAKGGELGYEDEKLSYVVASADPSLQPAAGRLVARPRHRKGHTVLSVCTREGGVRDVTVSRRQGETYRAARDAEWGDAWGEGPAAGLGR